MMAVKNVVTSMDGLDYSQAVATLTENYLKLCSHYELAAMLSRITGALLASAEDQMEDEEVMEFVITNVMEAKNGF